MKKLPTVTLLGVDCVNIDRLILAAEICMKDFEFAEVKLLTSLPSDHPDIVRIEPLDTIEAYSEFMVKKLNDYVDTPHVLIIQHDGFILNPDAWTDEFLKYDYIGAPWLGAQWLVDRFGLPKERIGTSFVGNGGFCLRTKTFLEVCQELDRTGAFDVYQPEDIMLTLWKRDLLEKAGVRFAPVELAERFSLEGGGREDKGWKGQFGFHGLRWTDISKWTARHPEYVSDMKEGTFKKIL